MIHIQDWKDYRNTIIFDEKSDSSIQFVIYNDNHKSAFLYSLYVSKSNRRKGYGTKLLTLAEKKAKESGCSFVRLKVLKSVNSALVKAFYIPLGYEEICEDEEYYELKKELN